MANGVISIGALKKALEDDSRHERAKRWAGWWKRAAHRQTGRLVASQEQSKKDLNALEEIARRLAESEVKVERLVKMARGVQVLASQYQGPLADGALKTVHDALKEVGHG